MELTLPRAVTHHIVDVLRLKRGSTLELFNGNGNNYAATLVSHDRQARIQLGESSPATNESPLKVTLWQAVSRAERMDASVRQAVELGAIGIQPIMTQRCQVKLDPKRAAKRHAHWSSIIVSASEQSGRATLPVLAPLKTLAQALEQRKGDHLGIVMSPETCDSLGSFQPEATPQHVDLLIGPESGFSAEEVRQAVDAGCIALRAGGRILRTETAGPAALAILQARFGDLT